MGKTKDINVKVFNMMTRINKANTLIKHISCDCKCKFKNATCNSDQKQDNGTYECKNYCKYTKNYSWNPSTCIYENDKYLKSIADTSVIVCDEIINATDSVSTNVTNTISTNVMSMYQLILIIKN